MRKPSQKSLPTTFSFEEKKQMLLRPIVNAPTDSSWMQCNAPLEYGGMIEIFHDGITFAHVHTYEVYEGQYLGCIRMIICHMDVILVEEIRFSCDKTSDQAFESACHYLADHRQSILSKLTDAAGYQLNFIRSEGLHNVIN